MSNREPLATTASSVRGSLFRGIQRCVRQRWGDAALEAAISRCGNEVGQALRYGQIVSVGWYPATWYSDFHKAAQRAVGGGPEMARELGYDSILIDLTTTQRHMLNLVTADTVLGQTNRLVALYWKGGLVETFDLQPQSARVRFSGWSGFDRNIWQDVIGGVKAMLVACSAHDVEWRILAGGRDHSRNLELELRWQPGHALASGG
jgi:hypothetical protein